MHRPISLTGYIEYKDIRASEVKQLLSAFNKESYVVIKGDNVYILTDNSILYYFKLLTTDINILAFQIFQLENYSEDILLYDPAIYNFVMDKAITITNISGNRIAEYEDLRSNEEFESLISMKAAEGMKFFRLPSLVDPGKSILIPIFSGFPKLSKPDKIGVIALKDDISVLIRFIIYKKKFNRNIDMYFRILDI